ncbi:MAG: hypothetical protein K1X57_07925 [Gemmataceae bacterium]|nr:hypothetical protein [Gemmataceae bacterium]
MAPHFDHRSAARKPCFGGASVVALVMCFAVGCSFGPKALEHSHGKFNHAVKQVEDEEILLNLVRLRYNENPLRIDVSGIAAQYELSGSAEARPFYSTEAANLGDVASSYREFLKILPFVGGSATNRPTFSLTPLDDPESLRQFFEPSTLDGIAFLAETSWPVSTVFRLCVDSMNRVPNGRSATGPDAGLTPEFREYQRATQIMQELQDAGDLRFSREDKLTQVGSPMAEAAVTATHHLEAAKSKLEYRQNEDRTWSLVRHDRRLALLINPKVLGEPHVAEFCRLLNLEPGQSRYEIALAGSDDAFEATSPARQHRTIAITTRSTIQTLFYVSYGVIVPARHYQCGLIKPTAGAGGCGFDWQEMTAGLFTVHSCSGHHRPKCAFTAVRYRDHWYYIDDRDSASKSTFALVCTMTRLNLLGSRKGGPVLTLPVGR